MLLLQYTGTCTMVRDFHALYEHHLHTTCQKNEFNQATEVLGSDLRPLDGNFHCSCYTFNHHPRGNLQNTHVL